MTSPLVLLQPQAQNAQNAQNATSQSSNSGFNGTGIPDFGGQSSFLSLLLGQIGENSNIDIDNLNIDFSNPTKSNGFQLNNASIENLGSLNVGDNILQTQNSAIGNNQGRIQEYSQKLREFLSSLIEQAQGGVPQAEVIGDQLSDFVQANNIAGSATAESANAQAASTATTPAEQVNAAASTQANAGTNTQKANAAQNIQNLIFDMANMAEQRPEAFIQQAALLSSGVSINDLNKIQSAINQLSPDQAEAVRLGLAGNIVGNGAQASADKANLPPVFAAADGVFRSEGRATSGTGRSGEVISSLLSGARGQAGSQSAEGANTAGLTNAAGQSAGANAQQNSILSSFFSFAEFVSQENGLYSKNGGQQMAGDAALQNQTLQASADVTAARNIANPQVSAQQAAMPHPASESLAVQIQRFAKANGDSRFMIEMDPPELGRVEVDIKFGGDKNMVTVMVDKPETYMMLQRDAGVLQKALQEMGIDLQGNDLNFNLSQGDNDGSSGNNNGSNKQSDGYAGFEDGQPSEIIESQMTQIYVDPRTGMVRLNIMA